MLCASWSTRARESLQIRITVGKNPIPYPRNHSLLAMADRLLPIAVVPVAIVAGLEVLRGVATGIRRLRAHAAICTLKDTASTPLGRLEGVAESMQEEMVKGLERRHKSRLKMIPTHVKSLPGGEELGSTFYALDLGGSNFRILRVDLSSGIDSAYSSKSVKNVNIPEELASGTTDDLFDYLGREVARFVKASGDQGISGDAVQSIGFTFSFPVEQENVRSGKLLGWTKVLLRAWLTLFASLPSPLSCVPCRSCIFLMPNMPRTVSA